MHNEIFHPASLLTIKAGEVQGLMTQEGLLISCEKWITNMTSKSNNETKNQHNHFHYADSYFIAPYN